MKVNLLESSLARRRVRDVVGEHLERNWGGAEVEFRSPGAPIEEVAPLLSFARYSRSCGSCAYATRGLSAVNREAPLELFLLAKREQALTNQSELLEALAAISHFHATGASLGVGHTVNLGRPWIPGSSCSHALVSLPYLDGPDLETGGGLSFECLWLVPITPGELAFKKVMGLEALESALEASGVDVVDFFRPAALPSGD